MKETEWVILVNSHTEELKERLIELKAISDLKEQSREITIAKNSFGDYGKLGDLKRTRPNSVIGYVSYLNDYEELLKELEDLNSDSAKKVNQQRKKTKTEQNQKENQLKSSHCSYCKSKPPTNHYIYSEKNKILKLRKRDADPYKKEYLFCSEKHFEKWHKKSHFTCAECSEENYTGKYKKNKKDGNKFCSNNCFYQHYAEKCDNCLEKCLKYSGGKVIGYAQTYYNDIKNKTGILCSKCHDEKLKEEAGEKRKDEEWEENSKNLRKSLDDLVDSMADAIEGKENEEDLDNDNNNSNTHTHTHREREREREQNQSQQSQLLSQIQQLESNSTKTPQQEQDLVTKKEQLEKLQKKEKELFTALPLESKISILEKEIKELEKKENKNKEEETLLAEKRKELERLLEEKEKENSNEDKNKEDKNSKIALYIGLGITGLFVFFLIIILARNIVRKQNKN